MTKKEYFFRIIILGFLTALGPFSIDMYLPGFPAIAKDLHTTTNEVALSLSSFFIGLSAGQLLYGPLLDRFGRKKPLYIGLVLYVLASVGCLAVTSIDQLIAVRFVQAIGSCAAAVASVAMVRDLFAVKDNAKVFSLLMLIVGLSPVLAPYVGMLVTAAFGWQWVFAILAIIGALTLLASIFKLPAVYQPDKSISLKPLPIISNFILVLKNPQFYTYVFAGAFAFSGLFAYVAGAPLVLMGHFHLSQQTFGKIFAGMSVSFIGCSQLNTLVMRKYKSEQIISVAVVAQVLVGVLFVLACLSGWINLYGILTFIFLSLSCLGFISSNANALALAPFTQNAGSASAVMGALQLGLGALTSGIIGIFKTTDAIPLASIMAVSSILAALVLFIGRRNIRHQVEVSADAVVMAH
jgi:DHA1 family bicyclomycin/chloramphenicol resistance-like MFS transporter